jgi:hypothetical protein
MFTWERHCATVEAALISSTGQLPEIELHPVEATAT